MEEIKKELIESFVENSKEIIEIEDKISLAIAQFKTELDDKKKKEVEIKDALKDAMKVQNVKKFENDLIALTYVAPTTRKTLDTEKLKLQRPVIYQEYLKESEVKDSIRIKIK